MNTPETLKYSKSHEWLETLPDGAVRVGITDYAQSQLGDIVFVNLPAPGDGVAAGGALADVESVKAVSDIFSPASGRVREVNTALEDAPNPSTRTPTGLAVRD
jgi:glycine cleavage system H protein